VPDTVVIGRVGKPHGLGGAFFVDEPSDDRARFAVGTELLADGEPARVVEAKHVSGRPVIRLDRTIRRGTALEVPHASLSPPEPGSYYVFQLVGLVVEDEGGRELGRVTDVAPGVANDVLELNSGVVLPMVEECIREIDLEHARIRVGEGFADPD
jgi:16S rRNA processing protein RimM